MKYLYVIMFIAAVGIYIYAMKYTKGYDCGNIKCKTGICGYLTANTLGCCENSRFQTAQGRIECSELDRNRPCRQSAQCKSGACIRGKCS